jgi:heme exporter protein C
MVMALSSVATLYAVLATITGAIWARFNWGVFWNWDPKQTSIFLVLLIYAAYFLLRGSIEDPERRARLSSVYSILGFVAAMMLFFILPRLLPGLHPGSSDDVNAGPLLSLKSDALNPTMNLVFGLSLFSFTLVFFWLTNLRVRVGKLMDAAASTAP